MKKCLVLMMLVCLSCSFAFGGTMPNNASWVSYGDHVSWESAGNWEWDYGAQIGAHAVPQYWHEVTIGNRMTGTHNITTASNIGVLQTTIGLSSHGVTAVTLNIGSGYNYYSGYNTSGTATATPSFFTAGSKATVNISGYLQTWGLDLNGGQFNINSGGYFKGVSNWWYIRNGGGITINDGGKMFVYALSGYGSAGISGGNIDLCGGEFQISGNKVTELTNLAQSNFFTAYGDTDDSKLSITYDGSKTYVTAVPEPATLALLGLGGLLTLRRKK